MACCALLGLVGAGCGLRGGTVAPTTTSRDPHAEDVRRVATDVLRCPPAIIYVTDLGGGLFEAEGCDLRVAYLCRGGACRADGPAIHSTRPPGPRIAEVHTRYDEFRRASVVTATLPLHDLGIELVAAPLESADTAQLVVRSRGAEHRFAGCERLELLVDGVPAHVDVADRVATVIGVTVTETLRLSVPVDLVRGMGGAERVRARLCGATFELADAERELLVQFADEVRAARAEDLARRGRETEGDEAAPYDASGGGLL